MPIPSFQEMFLPFLQSLADGRERHMREIEAHIAKHFSLTADDLAERIPSGQTSKLKNRAGWCRTHLKVAGLIETPKEMSALYKITEAGAVVVGKPPALFNLKFLDTFPPHFKWFHTPTKVRPDPVILPPGDGTPEERIEEAFNELRDTLIADLLAKLSTVNPFRFEQVVIDLLVKMGYGGSRKEAAAVTRKTGDEGIDGVINEDRLGLDVIYMQAKRWKSNVGRPEIQNFVGALAGKMASKGVFITTSAFHENAREYAAGLHQKVILIDGQRLAELMIEHGIGVAEEHAYHIKKVDSDYFDDES